MRLVELSRGRHAELRIRPELIEASAAGQHMTPVVVSEFRKAAVQYPIVFAKHSETGRFGAYVLSGLGVEENLFWSGTELDVVYVPLSIRRQPFYAGDNVLCVDLDHPCIDSAGSQLATDPAYVSHKLAILNELVAGQDATTGFIDTLLSMDLLAPLVLDIVLEDGTPLQLQGLYGLDEEHFRLLAVSGLWTSGYLDLIYAVLLSGGQMVKLIRLKNQRMAASRAWHSNSTPTPT